MRTWNRDLMASFVDQTKYFICHSVWSSNLRLPFYPDMQHALRPFVYPYTVIDESSCPRCQCFIQLIQDWLCFPFLVQVTFAITHIEITPLRTSWVSKYPESHKNVRNSVICPNFSLKLAISLSNGRRHINLTKQQLLIVFLNPCLPNVL